MQQCLLPGSFRSLLSIEWTLVAALGTQAFVVKVFLAGEILGKLY